MVKEMSSLIFGLMNRAWQRLAMEMPEMLDLELNRRNLGHSSPDVMEDHYLKIANSRFAKEMEQAIGDKDWALIQEETKSNVQPFKLAKSI
jgi:hypothetical protein